MLTLMTRPFPAVILLTREDSYVHHPTADIMLKKKAYPDYKRITEYQTYILSLARIKNVLYFPGFISVE